MLSEELNFPKFLIIGIEKKPQNFKMFSLQNGFGKFTTSKFAYLYTLKKRLVPKCADNDKLFSFLSSSESFAGTSSGLVFS